MMGENFITVKEFSKKFGDRLREKCVKEKKTLLRLSDDTGIGHSTLSYYLHGEVAPSAYNIYRIAKAFDCDINEFIDF